MSKGAKKKKKKNSAYTEEKRALEAQGGQVREKSGESKKKKETKHVKSSGKAAKKAQKQEPKKSQKKKTAAPEKDKAGDDADGQKQAGETPVQAEKEKENGKGRIKNTGKGSRKKNRNRTEAAGEKDEKTPAGTTEELKGTAEPPVQTEAAPEDNGSETEPISEKEQETEPAAIEKEQETEPAPEGNEQESEPLPEEDEPKQKIIFRREETEEVSDKSREGKIPSGILIILTMLYWEILFKQVTVRCNDAAGWMLTVAVSAAFGLLLSALISLAGEKAGPVLTILIEAFSYFIFTGQYVHYLFYSSFFSLFSLLSGTGQVAQFAGSIFKVMAGKAFNIFLLTLPFLLSVILIVRKRVKFRRSIAWTAVAAVVAVLVLVLMPMSLNRDDGRMYSPYKVFYEINSPFYSVRYFGLTETVAKDVYRYLTGFEEKTVIVVPSDTEGVDDDRNDAEKEYNALEIDFTSLADSESNETIAGMHRYFSTVKPTEKNDYTGIFEGKNLIYIVAEALCYGAIDPEITPTLYKMASEGISFTNYYSPLYYASTFDGEYMTLLSLIPRDGEWSLYTARNNSLPYSYGNAFRKIGYRSEAYHGWWYDYYYRDETHPNLGYVWNAVGSGLDVNANYWPPSDVEVVEKSVPEFISDSPFMVYYLSISGHLGYTFSGNTMSTKHKPEVADLPYSEPVRAYYACQKEFDDSLALLLSDLEEQGILDDTVIVISNDHYPYGLMNNELMEFCDYIQDEKFDIHKGVFLIYNSATEGEQVDTVCSSLDALPTVSNMFGLEYDSRLLMGVDVMSGSEPVLILSDRSWKTSSGTYDASTETFRKTRLAEISQNYVDEMNQKVYYKFLMSRYILDYDYYSLID